MIGRGILTSHSVAPISSCEHRGCQQPVSKISIHLVTPLSGEGLQALVISQQCEVHDAELLSELRCLYETRPPTAIMRGGIAPREGRHE
jgi:hypothetical protein